MTNIKKINTEVRHIRAPAQMWKDIEKEAKKPHNQRSSTAELIRLVNEALKARK